jgi:KaiC/GvpD/RAD55 family RecA-like ATPase/ABC-type glycerol-3-phosphate transport system substrate-binding protein
MGQYGEGAELNLKSLFHDTGETPQNGDVLLIDGVSLLTASAADRKKVIALIDEIKEQELFAILVVEEAQPFPDRLLEYAVDGIIRLSVDSVSGLRNLEIAKWRWGDYCAGKHSFRFRTYEKSTGKGGVELFPSLSCLINQQNGRKAIPALFTEPIKSGTPGLDELIDPRGGFRAGDRILLLGPSGVGKMKIGMQFLNECMKEESGASVFVSFSHDHQQATNRSGKECSSNRLHRLYYSISGICLDEVVGAIHNLLAYLEEENGPHALTRLFVENMSELRRLFTSEQDYEAFLVSFIAMLKKFPSVVSMISIQLPLMFASYAKVSIPAATHFTVVIGLNLLEQHNMLIRGLVVLRALDRPHNTELKLVSVEQNGIFKVDPLGGFNKVGLLSGDPAPIHEEKLFLKLFFQNASEEEVIKRTFNDFKARYPNDQTFIMVCTKNPNPDHWSFLGYSGVGHSNTKVVLLDKSTADIIRERKALTDVPPDLVEKFAERFDSKQSLFGSETPDSAVKDTFMLPYCADVGVLVYQWDVLRDMTSKEPPQTPKTWGELLELKSNLKSYTSPDSNKPIKYLFVIPNPATDAKNFVAFFLELCWNFGWEYNKENDVVSELTEWIRGHHFRNAVGLMQRLVLESDGLIPNPLKGGHYHQAVFARRWFSKIHLRPDDAMKRADAAHPAFQFGIAPLPGITSDRLGYAYLDLYVLGIVSGALAPETGWMLASQFLGVDVDFDRALKKRGLPVVRTILESEELEGQLRAAVPPPKQHPNFYQQQERIFEQYPKTLRQILSRENPLFKRASDIPRFARLQKVLAQSLPKLFDENDRYSHEQVIERIEDCLTEIYR